MYYASIMYMYNKVGNALTCMTVTNVKNGDNETNFMLISDLSDSMWVPLSGSIHQSWN